MSSMRRRPAPRKRAPTCCRSWMFWRRMSRALQIQSRRCSPMRLRRKMAFSEYAQCWKTNNPERKYSLRDKGCCVDDLWRLSISEASEALARREISAVELTRAHLDRIEDV